MEKYVGQVHRKIKPFHLLLAIYSLVIIAGITYRILLR